MTIDKQKKRFGVGLAVALLLMSLLVIASCTKNIDNGETQPSQTYEQTQPQSSTNATTVNEGTSADISTQAETESEREEQLSTVLPAEDTVNGFIDICYSAILSVSEIDRAEYKKVLTAADKFIADEDSVAFRKTCEQAVKSIGANIPQEIIVPDSLSAQLAENGLVYQKLTSLAQSQMTEKSELLEGIDRYLDTMTNLESFKKTKTTDEEKYAYSCQLSFAKINDALLTLPADSLEYFQNTYLPLLATLNSSDVQWTDNEMLLHVQIDNLSALVDDCENRLEMLS